MALEADLFDTVDDAVSGFAVPRSAVSGIAVPGAARLDAAKVARVAELVRELAACEVSGLPQEELVEAHGAIARLGRLTDALGARIAGEVARRSAPDLPGGGLARRQGFGSAAAMVAAVTGGSRAGAWRAIEAGRAFMPEPVLVPEGGLPAAGDADGDGTAPPLSAAPPLVAPSAPRYPAVAAAALAGELSVDAAGLMVAGLETLTDRVPDGVLHALEERLVAKAVGLTASEVRRLVAHAVARADVPGLEARERRQYAERFVSFTEDHTGMVSFTGRLDAVTAAPIRTVIEQVVTQQFRARRDQDPLGPDRRTVGQMRADALFEVCRHALGCNQTDRSGIRTTIVVRMNKSDLDAATSATSTSSAAPAATSTSAATTGTSAVSTCTARPGGVGSIDGIGVPVSVGGLRRLAGDAGIIPAVLSGDSEVLDLGRTVRMFTRAQRLALLERDGGCAKCHAPPEHCEAHHIRWWDNGGTTDLSNGVMLCTRCHHDIHRHGWGIRATGERVEFIPPPDIDPTQTPRPGGLAAIHLSDAGDTSNHGGDGDVGAALRDVEGSRWCRGDGDTGESSAQGQDTRRPADRTARRDAA